MSPATLHLDRHRWWGRGATALALLLLWLGVSAPWFTSSGVGTGEAYNYSLALADGVTQLRAGEIPVLVGQTEYAFNGRVHPLRHAPYLIYLAGALDLVTLRQLSFWQLQNFSLSFSLALAVLLTWAGIRWSSGGSSGQALGVTALFVLSPPLLGAAYSIDLYMTVHAAPFVPLALAAAAREFRIRSAANDLVLIGALAAAWWAHPPVALWTTAAAMGLRGWAAAHPPAGRSWARVLALVPAVAALVAFVFISALEITPYRQLSDSGEVVRDGFVRATLDAIAATFPGVLLPVSRGAQDPTDLQLGYGLALVLVVSAGLATLRRPNRFRGQRHAIGGLLAVGAGLVLLALPVPVLTPWIWSHLPTGVHTLTGAWPNQRLYLVAAAAIVVAAAWVQAARPAGAGRWRLGWFAGAALLALWTGWQAYPFLHRGFEVRWDADSARRRHLPHNVDLTVTSYAFLGLPPTFAHGVMEPWAEFQLVPVRSGLDPIGVFEEALARGQAVTAGELVRSSNDPAGFAAESRLTLQPETRYILAFDWEVPVSQGTLVLRGESTERRYFLPRAGETRGFGIGGAHRRGFALSTGQATAEEVEIHLQLDAAAADAPPGTVLARFTLREVPAGLPVELTSLQPLRMRVTSPADGYYVETPRRHLPGYVATVNDRPVQPAASASGQVMLPVPAGTSEVELRFAGSPALHRSFWAAVAGWAALVASGGGWLVLRRRRPQLAPLLLLAPPVLATGCWWLLAVEPGTRPGRPLSAAGPLLFELSLPADRIGNEEVVLSSGRPGAGNVLSVRYVDAEHVRVALDAWGAAVVSEPVRVDYRQPVELTVSAGFLYPPDAPGLQALPPWWVESLRQQVQVEVNGQRVLDRVFSTHPSAPAELGFGRSTIGGSLAGATFTGTLRDVRRLPVPVADGFADAQHLEVRWPLHRQGVTEPLLLIERRSTQDLLTARFLPGNQLEFGFEAADGRRWVTPPLAVPESGLQQLAWEVQRSSLQFTLDHVPVLTIAGWLEEDSPPLLVWTGTAGTARPGVAARFTGPQLDLRVPAAPTEVPPGPVRLLLQLPMDKTGTAEPLVITGEAGRADAVYLTYSDPEHIQFGLDHWGVGAHLSEPIPVAYDQLNQLEVEMGSLYPPVGSGDWGQVPVTEQQARKEVVIVRLNGQEVWRLRQETYDVDRSTLAVANNAIGVSSCGPKFTGQVLKVEHPGQP